MSTRLALGREYPYDVPVFAAVLADVEFHRAKLDVDGSGRIEVLSFSCDSCGDSPGDGSSRVRVRLRQPVPPGQVPAVVERLLSGMLVIERTEEWILGAERCRGRAHVAVPGTPITAGGSMDVAPTPTGSRLSVDLDVTASVPLLGGRIERAVVAGIRGLTGTEHDRISRWLERAGRGS